MERILTGYEMNHVTWFYLSFLLVVAVYVRFHRPWSLRNLDLALLLSIAPGILFLETASLDADVSPPMQQTLLVSGYVWLLVVTALWLVRLLCDGLFRRRPRLEQNLNSAGLSFLAIASFAFLVTSALRESEVPESTRRTIAQAENLVHGGDEPGGGPLSDRDTSVGLVSHLLLVPTTAFSLDGTMTARIAAILSHLAVVLGLWYTGWVHFRDAGVGLAMATLYVLLPPTSSFVGEVNHVLPAALVVWAVATVHQPLLAGALLGLACGTQVFAIFLLPLWCTWFWRGGLVRFASAWTVSLAVAVAVVAITASSSAALAGELARAVDWAWLFTVDYSDGEGFWQLQYAAWRIPAFVGFLVAVAAMTLWPVEKQLDQLLARSAAVVVGTQFWYPQQGGTYVLWYLPLVLLVVFRPNLDRVRFGRTESERVHREDDPTRDAPVPAPVTGTSRYVFR